MREIGLVLIREDHFLANKHEIKFQYIIRPGNQVKLKKNVSVSCAKINHNCIFFYKLHAFRSFDAKKVLQFAKKL